MTFGASHLSAHIASPEKILIIRLSAIGDILLATPLIRALRASFPNARLDFVVKARFAEVLRHHPAIADVYVFGVPDEKFGEEVAAAIRLKPDMAATEDEIKMFCREQLAQFKIPRFMRFIETFPMTASGKVQRFKLREMFIEQESGARSQESA